MTCEKCGKEISEKVKKFSTGMLGKAYCMDCQKIVRTEKAKDNVQSTHLSLGNEDIITLQGKQYVTHKGLLKKAHAMGLVELHTELLTSPDADMVVFKATATMLNKNGNTASFTDYGDATNNNVNRMIVPHKLRMASTRAINRVLRLATGDGRTSIEELGE